MNIIIQAGGKGTRLKHHTTNKPKCLLEFDGKTLLERQLENYKNNKIYIIGDYKIDVLKKYVKVFFKEYDIQIIYAKGGKGTLSGLKEVLNFIDNLDPIIFLWSDLILKRPLEHKSSDIQVFTTNDFPCRYRLDDNINIIKEVSTNDGIMGAFTIKNKQILSSIPETGSFVSGWLKDNLSKIKVIKTPIMFTSEVGELKHLDGVYEKSKSRFFNSLEIKEKEVIKRCIDHNYRHLIAQEKDWYRQISKLNYNNIPNILSYDPLKMERIIGSHGHKKANLWSKQKKRKVFNKIVTALHNLHNLSSCLPSAECVKQVYKTKTFDRIEKVSHLIPFIECDLLHINGKKYRNPLHQKERGRFLNKIEQIQIERFDIIHGDPTFNNFLITDDDEIFFFDPRGSFGKTSIYGDKRYDWAKLYYSIVGNYDSVNEKRFKIKYNNNDVKYTVDSNGWEFLEEELIKQSKVSKQELLLLNCLIWFSLCGYLKDYDSILMSYVKGVELWNQI